MKQDLNIVFMGTPQFAVPALHALTHSRHTVALVVTQPDRRKGRGLKMAMPPVKKAALKLGLNVLQPDAIRGPEFFSRLSNIQPDLIVVVAFSHILPKALIELPPLGTLNIHPSLLPKYRGPAPIQWAVINEEQETGIAIMQMDEGMDTGEVLLTCKQTIYPDDTAGTLHDRLALAGAELLIETLEALCAGNISPSPQDHQLATYAPLLKKKTGRIDWHQPATTIDCFIRGMTPWPGAFTFHQDNRLKILKAAPLQANMADSPGVVVKGFADELRIATTQGFIRIEEIQGASGKRLPVADFLRGYKLKPGDRFT
jgi:methionyl-tRNA formyltransferase